MIVDVHTHLTAAAIGRTMDGPEEPPFPAYAFAPSCREAVNKVPNLAYLDTAGVDMAVLLPLPVPPGAQVPPFVTTETVLEHAREHPDRFIPFGTFDPRQPGLAYADEVKRLVDSGCRGFGEWKPNPPTDSMRVDDPRIQEVYGLCGEAGLPVLLHLDDNINRDIDGFEEMVRAFPRTRFIAHGPAWWAHMAANPPEGTAYPEGPVEEPGRVDQMLARYPNLYADVSAGSGLRALSRDLTYTLAFARRHWRQLLLGTDFPCRNGRAGTTFGVDRAHRDLIEELDLTPEERNAILGGNVLRIIRPV
ncbi:MAG: amidohydrolase family protein [Anaerolineae bacterium]|nr:amidohydrolase family protein [Anaerolineae bacterium]